MRTTLTHLPAKKRAELRKITKIIQKLAHVEMILLFGSYSRDDWVDRDVNHEERTIYESDFDILVIVRNKRLEKKAGIWQEIEDEIRDDPSIRTPVRIIVDTINFVQQKLKQGRYFYADIYRESVQLYNSGEFKLNKPVDPEDLPPAQRQQFAREDFKNWFDKAEVFFRLYKSAVKEANASINLSWAALNLAAFHLHQTTENLFTAMQLCFTAYKPKTHDLEELDEEVCKLHSDFKNIFPRKTKIDKYLFDLLKRAYVESRYSKDYKISQTELEALAKQIQALQKMTKRVCLEKIKSFR